VFRLLKDFRFYDSRQHKLRPRRTRRTSHTHTHTHTWCRL